MPDKYFSVHGSLSLWVEESILMLEGTGPWNLESVNQSDEQAENIKHQLYGQPWGAILTLFGDPIYVPEAAEIITDSVKEDRQNGRICSAVLVNQCNSPEFGRRHITKIYNDAGETFKFFDEIEDAKDWVKQCVEAALS